MQFLIRGILTHVGRRNHRAIATGCEEVFTNFTSAQNQNF
jgi:hypothetical protein